MGLTAVSLFLTVLVLNIHHHSDHSPLPKWAHRVILQYLAYILCMRSSKNKPNNIQQMTDEEITQLPAENDSKMNSSMIIPSQIMTYVAQKQDEDKENKIQDKNAAEWRAAARVVDRLFFWVYIIISVISTLVMVCLILTGSKHNDALRKAYGI